MPRPNRRLQHLRSMRLWLAPGMKVKRFVSVTVVSTLTLVVGVIAGVLWVLEGNRQSLSTPIETVLVSNTWNLYGGWISIAMVLLGLGFAIQSIAWLNRSLLSNWMHSPRDAASVLHKRLSLSRGPKIVAIGGGTGLSNLLRGLRQYSSNITAVVTVSDDGGSSGRLRDAFDMPAPGDLTDCLAALSDNESEVSRLLEYRFKRGKELEGHTFGNLLITTLTEVEGDFAQAVRTMNALLNLTGRVYPITPEAVSLHVEKVSGKRVHGESRVRDVNGAISKVMIDPSQPRPTPEVISAFLEADIIVLGPGSLFTSTIPPLLVPAARHAIRSSKAELIYISNIMTEAGETDNFSAFDHVEAIYKHLGRYPEHVLVNQTKVDEARLERYYAEGADVVTIDREAFAKAGIRLTALPLLSAGRHAQHDSNLLAQWLSDHAKQVATSPQRKDLIAV